MAIVSDSVNRGTSTARRTHASLYNYIVYKRGSKARERKGEERKHRSKLYTILWSRDGKLRQSNGNLPVPFSTSAVTAIAAAFNLEIR